MRLLNKTLLILSLFLCTSCLEIIEEISMNPNGSGTLSLTLNASQSKSNLDKVMAKDSIYGEKVPHRKDIEKAIADVNAKLKATKGITNLVITRDFVNYILVIKCNFDNPAALNSAINNIWLLYDKNAKVSMAHVSFEQNTFKRNFDYNLIKNLREKLGNEARDILIKCNYTSIYRFSTEISNFTNKDALPSKSKKAIILKNNLLDLVQGKKSIQNQITLK